MQNLLIAYRLPEQVLADFNWKPAPRVKRKRPFTVAIRLSLIEKNLIEARRGSLSVADFMRASAIGQNVVQREMVRRVIPPRVDAELKRQIAYLGNNLNQLTTIAHEHHNAGNLNVVTLASELAYIRYQLDYLINTFTVQKKDDEKNNKKADRKNIEEAAEKNNEMGVMNAVNEIEELDKIDAIVGVDASADIDEDFVQ